MVSQLAWWAPGESVRTACASQVRTRRVNSAASPGRPGDPVPPAAGDVHVLGRVLPLPHRHHGGRAGERGSAEDVRALLLVGAPQDGRPFHEAGQRAGVRGGGFAGAREADVVEGDGPVHPGREDLTDQVGHLPAGPLSLQPPGDGGVFVSQTEPAGPPGLVDVRPVPRARPRPRPGSRRAGCWVAWAPPVDSLPDSVMRRPSHGVRTEYAHPQRARAVAGSAGPVDRRASKEAGRVAGSPSYSAAARSHAVRPAACPTLRGGADGSAGCAGRLNAVARRMRCRVRVRRGCPRGSPRPLSASG